MILVWFYKRTHGDTLQSLYLTDMTLDEIKEAFREYGEDGGPFFLQAEHLTNKFLHPIVDSDVDNAEFAEKVIEHFLKQGDIEAMVDLSDSDTEPKIMLM